MQKNLPRLGLAAATQESSPLRNRRTHRSSRHRGRFTNPWSHVRHKRCEIFVSDEIAGIERRFLSRRVRGAGFGSGLRVRPTDQPVTRNTENRVLHTEPRYPVSGKPNLDRFHSTECSPTPHTVESAGAVERCRIVEFPELGGS